MSPSADAVGPQSFDEVILFVDLDGTLVVGDLLWESLLLAIRQQPFCVLLLPFWLMRGRAGLKRAIARRAAPNARTLVYRESLIEFLQKQKRRGSRIVLATASDAIWAERVAGHLGLFDDVLASDGEHNLKGADKLAAIEAYCREHQSERFAYIGDSSADLPIWKQASKVYVVAPTSKLLASIEAFSQPEQIFGRQVSQLTAALRVLRPFRWAKNLLLWIPLIAAHQLGDLTKTIALLPAFVAYCACASAAYGFNDLIDLVDDRRHPLKCHKPFATGALPLAYGPPLVCGLAALGLGLSIATLPWSFTGILSLYLVFVGLYSLWFERVFVPAVAVLASLSVSRLIAGAVAADVELGMGLIIASVIVFGAIDGGRRYRELKIANQQPPDKICSQEPS